MSSDLQQLRQKSNRLRTGHLYSQSKNITCFNRKSTRSGHINTYSTNPPQDSSYSHDIFDTSDYFQKSAIHPFCASSKNSATEYIECNISLFIKSTLCLFMLLLILGGNLLFKDYAQPVITNLQHYISMQQNPEEIKNSLEHILLEVLS